MKNKKYYLLALISILFFNFLLYNNIIFFSNNIDKPNRDFKINLSTNISYAFEWNRTWGRKCYYCMDFSDDVAVDSSDNIYVTGDSPSLSGGGTDVFILKYTSSGILEWNSTWGNMTSSNDYGYGVATDSSDDVYIVGTTIRDYIAKDIILLKYDTSGVFKWSRTLGDIIHDEGVSIVVDSLDNIYFTGIWNRGWHKQKHDIILAKYDQSGTQQWNRTWGGSDFDRVSNVVVDSLDNIYVTGIISQVGFLVKYDGDGVVKWNVTNPHNGGKLAIDSSDNVYISGGGYLIKYSSSGVLQWETIISTGSDIVLDSLGNFYFVGTSDDDIFLMQCNSSGVKQWTITLASDYYEDGKAIAIDSLDNIYLAGDTSFEYDTILVKFNPVEEEEEEEGKDGGGTKIIRGYPLLLFLSTIGLLTVFSLKKKFN